MGDKNDVVIINLDRPRILRFGHKALKKLTALTGKGMDAFDLENFDFEDLEKIIWCGLLHEDPSLKFEDMEDLLDQAESYNEILEKMNLAFNAAFGSHVVDEKN